MRLPRCKPHALSEDAMDNVCAECGHETDQENGPCVKCKSLRIVSISVVEQIFGPDWKSSFEKPK